jgi:hypothetical protein
LALIISVGLEIDLLKPSAVMIPPLIVAPGKALAGRVVEYLLIKFNKKLFELP